MHPEESANHRFISSIHTNSCHPQFMLPAVHVISSSLREGIPLYLSSAQILITEQVTPSASAKTFPCPSPICFKPWLAIQSPGLVGISELSARTPTGARNPPPLSSRPLVGVSEPRAGWGRTCCRSSGDNLTLRLLRARPSCSRTRGIPTIFTGRSRSDTCGGEEGAAKTPAEGFPLLDSS